MEAIAERGHSAMTWLLVLGLIAAWAAFDQPPPVIDTAYGIAMRVLEHPEYLGIEGDPLEGLPPTVRTPLSQLRYEYFRPEFEYELSFYQACCTALEPVTVESVLLLGREALKRSEQAPSPTAMRLLTAERLSQDMARLEAWHHKSGLSPSASLLDLRTELGSRIQVPGTEQSLDVPHCLIFVGLGIAGLQLYLLSLLATMGQLPAGAPAAARSWVVLHRMPLGPVLAMLWICLPGVAWFLAAVTVPMIRMESHPTAVDWTIAAVVGATLTPMLRLVMMVRRRHLNAPVEPTASLAVAEQRKAA